MLDVGLIRILRDSYGTAEGRCLRCGAFFSVTIPSDAPATEVLFRLFEKHLSEKHSSIEQGIQMNAKVSAHIPHLLFQPLNTQEAHLLEQVAEKLVRYGQTVGITPEEIISLLDSGISIRDLLALMASKTSGAA